MLRVALLSMILLSTVSVLGSNAHAETRLALLIGNSEYEIAAPLRNPQNDVELLRDPLTAAGFKTSIVLNADQNEFTRAVEEFLDEADEADDPVLLVYFAGHGIQQGGENYLLATDADVKSADTLRDNALRLDRLMRQLAAAEPLLSIVIVDACRNDPFEQRERSAIPIAKGLTTEKPRNGQVVAFSTAPGVTASDGQTGNSPYATAFAEAIVTPGTSLKSVFDLVRNKVAERTNGAQVPWESVSTFHDFFFVAPAQQGITEAEALLWEQANVAQSGQVYQRYLTSFPEGRYAAIARKRLEMWNREFKYRRSAEFYEVYLGSGDEIDFCKVDVSEDTTFGSASLSAMRTLVDRIVYVDFTIGYSGLLCANEDMRDGLRVAAVVDSLEDCNDLLWPANQRLEWPEIAGSGDGYVGRFDCLPTSDLGGEADTGGYIPDIRSTLRSVGSNGAILIENFGDYFAFPALSQIHYKLDNTSDETEGIFENSAIKIKGLVRIEERYEDEESKTLVFTPVDPAANGLSWKFEATVDALRDPGSSGIKVRTLREMRDQNKRDAAEALRASIQSYWDYNGTTLGFHKDEDNYVALYLVGAAAQPEWAAAGDLAILFEGSENGAAAWKGSAYTYPKGCDESAFDATARIDVKSNALLISGKTPVLDRNCKESGAKKKTIKAVHLRDAAQ